MGLSSVASSIANIVSSRARSLGRCLGFMGDRKVSDNSAGEKIPDYLSDLVYYDFPTNDGDLNISRPLDERCINHEAPTVILEKLAISQCIFNSDGDGYVHDKDLILFPNKLNGESLTFKGKALENKSDIVDFIMAQDGSQGEVLGLEHFCFTPEDAARCEKHLGTLAGKDPSNSLEEKVNTYSSDIAKTIENHVLKSSELADLTLHIVTEKLKAGQSISMAEQKILIDAGIGKPIKFNPETLG